MITSVFQNLTDEQLVTQFQVSNKDNLLFGEIYNRYYKKVHHTCMSIVKDQEVAYDLLQDIMIKVMEHLPKLKHGQLLGLWIHRIARNYSLDYCKDRNRQRIVHLDEYFHMAKVVNYSESLIVKEKRLRSIEKLMPKLREEDRTFLKLKYFDNYSIKDLQDEFGLSQSAVKMRLARARNRIQHLYYKDQASKLIQSDTVIA